MEFFSHLVLVVFASFVIYSAVPGSSLFSWHPTCMVLAAALWTESIICFRRPRPSWRVNVHWATNALAVTLAINGFLSIYRHKDNEGYPHFATYHGLAGGLTMALLLIQTIGGNFANLSVILSKFVGAIKPSIIKWGHRVSGAMSISAVYTTLILALCSSWFSAIIAPSVVLWWGIVLCVIYPGLYAVFTADFSSPKAKQSATKAKAK